MLHAQIPGRKTQVQNPLRQQPVPGQRADLDLKTRAVHLFEKIKQQPFGPADFAGGGQIEQAMGVIEDFEDSISLALGEGDIELLRRFNERKLLVNTFNADASISELK